MTSLDKAIEKHPEFSALTEPMFKDYVTLDPSRSLEVWEDLSRDTTMEHIASLGAITLLALIVNLEKLAEQKQ